MHRDPRQKYTEAARDPQEFSRLYETYLGRVLTYMNYRCEDQNTAEDLTAQVFERVLNNLHRYKPQGQPFEAWLFTIARNVVNDYYRSKKWITWIPLEKIIRKPSRQIPPEQEFECGENHQVLINAVKSLKKRESEIIALRFGACFTNRQIAVQTGLSEQNVAIIIYRSLKKLKLILECDQNTGVSEEKNDR